MGGKAFINGSSGGLGGGVIYLKVTRELQNDGEISSNGGSGSSAGGGGSGGSILMDIANIKVLPTFKKSRFFLLTTFCSKEIYFQLSVIKLEDMPVKTFI